MRSTIKVIAGLMLVVFAGQAFADLAASHIIRNTVTVDYNDAGGTDQLDVEASVDITVNLVPLAPAIALDTDVSDDVTTVNTNDTVTLVFNVTALANGVDDYELNTLALSGTAAGTSSIDPYSPDPLELGASTYSGAPTITVFDDTDQTDATTAGTLITVPSDDVGAGAGGVSNGLQLGDRVFIGGLYCSVNHVVEPAATFEANSETDIYVDQCTDGPVIANSSAQTAGSLAQGAQFGEVGQFTVVINTGAVSGDLDFDANVDIDGNGAGTPITTVEITILANDLRVFKFVRNGTTGANNPTCGSAPLNTPMSCITLDGGTSNYYRENVTTDPGDTLEYAIVLINNGGQATAIQVTDPIVVFTTFDTGTIDLIPLTTDADPDSGTVEPLTGADCIANGHTCDISGTFAGPASDATTDDYGEFASNTVTVSGGHDGTGTEEGDATGGGLLESGEVSVLTFTVSVDN